MTSPFVVHSWTTKGVNDLKHVTP